MQHNTHLRRRARLFWRGTLSLILLFAISVGGAAAQEDGLLERLIAEGAVSPGTTQSPFTTRICFDTTVTSVPGLVTDPTNPNIPSASSISVSADGRYMVFQSDADNLVPGDVNKSTDIFRYDRLTCTIELVSLNSAGEQGYFFSIECDPNGQQPVECVGQGWSRRPSVSDDGRYISFTSLASNLDPLRPDTNTWRDIFVRDMIAQTTFRVSVSSTGVQGAQANDGSTISGDGRYIAFYSASGLLLPPGQATNFFCQRDANPATLEKCYDVYVHDRIAQTTERVSISSAGAQGNNDSGQNVVNINTIVPVDNIGVSFDGRYIAFYSLASNLVAGDTNSVADIFVRDRTLNTTTRVSISSSGTQGNGESIYPDMSNDGRYVVFESEASNLIAGDVNNTRDVFIRDTVAGTTSIISLSSIGTQTGLPNYQPVISGNGRYVAFTSDSSNLQVPFIPVQTDVNALPDIYVHDRQTSRTQIVSSRFDGTQGNGGSRVAAISDDGLFVGFQSDANNLIANDTNNARDVFLTKWQEVSFKPDASMIINSGFNSGLNNWNIFGLPNNPPTSIVSGALEFYRETAATQAVVFQNTHFYLWANSPIEAQVQVGNTSNVRKRFVMLAHEGDFSDLQICSFWIPANAPLQTYTLRAKTNKNWRNVTISLYASSNDGLPAYRVDNVTLTYRPTLSQLQTRSECIDPNAPLPTADPDSANLIVNGTFDGGTFAPWSVFTPAPGSIVAALNSGVAELYRPTLTDAAGSLLQNTGFTGVAAGQPLELRMQLGNSSSALKRVTILLHHQNFADFQVCIFWLPPFTPVNEYVMRTHSSTAWTTGASISYYISTIDNLPAVRLDNVELRVRPSLSVGGTSCFLPGAGVLTDPRDTMLPTLMPTLGAVPELQGELPLMVMTPTPPLESGNEGSVIEQPELLPTATWTPEFTLEPTATLEPTTEATATPEITPEPTLVFTEVPELPPTEEPPTEAPPTEVAPTVEAVETETIPTELPTDTGTEGSSDAANG